MTAGPWKPQTSACLCPKPRHQSRRPSLPSLKTSAASPYLSGEPSGKAFYRFAKAKQCQYWKLEKQTQQHLNQHSWKSLGGRNVMRRLFVFAQWGSVFPDHFLQSLQIHGSVQPQPVLLRPHPLHGKQQWIVHVHSPRRHLALLCLWSPYELYKNQNTKFIYSQNPILNV